MLLRKELGWLSIKKMIVTEISTLIYKSLNEFAPQYLFVRQSNSYTCELRKHEISLTVVKKSLEQVETTILKKPPRCAISNQS